MNAEETITLERLVESLGDASLVLGADGSIIAVNAAAETLYNAVGGELLGRPFLSMCDGVDLPLVAHALATCNGVPVRFTARKRRLDGSSFIGSFSAKRHSPVEGEGSPIVLLVREAEQHFYACTDDLELHQLMLEHSLDGILAHTVDGHLLFANHAAQKQWGLSAEEVRARGAWGWVEQDARTQVSARITQLLESGEARFESHSKASGGRALHQEINARIVHTSEGAVVVSTVRDISERMQAEELVRYLAYHDTLTGVANRPMLSQRLTQEIAAAQRHGDLLGVVFLDLDAFKPINDTYGHATGDNVLRVVADRLSCCVRESDMVARFGGDEFVVVLPRLAHTCDLKTVADKIREEIAAPIWIGDTQVRVQASIGIAAYNPGDDADTLLNRADLNMYETRETGRDEFDATV